MRRRVASIAVSATLLGVLLVCFGATAGLADRCRPDEGDEPGRGHGRDPDCPETTVPTTEPEDDPPATAPATTPATSPATAPPRASVPAPTPTSAAAPPPTAARSKASVAASATPEARPRLAGATEPTTTAPTSPPPAAAEPGPTVPQLQAPTTTAEPQAQFALASADDRPAGLRSGPTLLPTLALVALGGLLCAIAYWCYVTVLGRR